MLATHVDDILYACKPGYEHLVQKIFDKFEVRETQTGKIRFCGREILQDETGIRITCKDTAEKVLPINFRKDGRNAEDKATDGEISQLRSVVGSLSWVARQCRPELSYYASKLQSAVSGARVKHLQEANKALALAVAESDRGLFYKTGAVKWDSATLITITDASWAGEKLYNCDGQVFPRRSQRGKFILLADKSIWDGDKANAYVLSWKSTMIKRVCRSTMAAETQSLLGGVADGMRMRAVIADLTDQIEFLDWRKSSANAIPHLWLTDCESLNSYLVNPIASGNEDSRLELDLEDLRQMLWEDELGNLRDTLSEEATDKVRWIDTSTMLADPLTKNMKPLRLLEFLESGIIDLEATDESKLQKMLKQKQRKSAKEAKTQNADEEKTDVLPTVYESAAE